MGAIMVRRLGVIGDVHAEDQLLQAAVECLRSEGAELVVCTGDLCDGGGDVEACCEIVAHEQIVIVRGNHDRWCLTGRARDLPGATQLEGLSDWARSFLERLEPSVELGVEGGPLLLCHGIGDNDMGQLKAADEGYALDNNWELQKILREDHFRYMVAGHTHEEMVRRLGRMTVVNAGTLSRDHQPGFVLIDFASALAQFFHFEGGGVTPGAPINLIDLDEYEA